MLTSYHEQFKILQAEFEARTKFWRAFLQEVDRQKTDVELMEFIYNYHDVDFVAIANDKRSIITSIQTRAFFERVQRAKQGKFNVSIGEVLDRIKQHDSTLALETEMLLRDFGTRMVAYDERRKL